MSEASLDHVYSVDQMVFLARLNAKYHRQRSAHHNTVARAGNAFTVVLGSATAVSLLSSMPWLAPYLAAATTFFGTAAVVYDPARQSYDHTLLSKQWMQLESDLAPFDHGAPITAAQLSVFEQRALAIEISEPPLFEVVLHTCHADLVHPEGRWGHAPMKLMPWLLRKWGTWFSIRVPAVYREQRPQEGAAA